MDSSSLPRARKRFGQHFLHDTNVIEKIITNTTNGHPQHIVEIGPGQGAITKGLINKADKLSLIEIDRDLAHFHRNLWKNQNVEVIEEDILNVDLTSLTPQPFNLVGNLPYNISTPILFKLTEYRATFVKAILMLQKEVVDRMIALEGEKARGRLSIGIQRWFKIERLVHVPAGAFNPPPKVESTVISLTPLDTPKGGECDELLLAQIVQTSFSQRRKMLRKSLAKIIDEAVFKSVGIDSSRRPETLSLDEFVLLCRAQSLLST